MTCNCPSCRGEGPPDDDEIEVPDSFIEEWIEDNRDKIVDHFLRQIEEAYAEKRSSDLEEQAIELAEFRKEWDDGM